MNLKYYFYELWSIFVDHGLPLIALLLIGILIPRIGRLAIRIIERRLDEDEESTKARLALTGALVYIVQVTELLRSTQILITRLQEPLFLLLICGAFYFLISFPLARFGGWLERRWSHD